MADTAVLIDVAIVGSALLLLLAGLLADLRRTFRRPFCVLVRNGAHTAANE